MKQQLVFSSELSAVKLIGFLYRKFSRFNFITFLIIIAYCSLPKVQAQQEERQDMAPPPLKIISRTEKSQLEALTDIKQYTKLALELMEARLLNAERYSAKEEYNEMFAELGSFHALVDSTLNFLNTKDTENGKVLNNFKRIELSLRKYITRLELIRRDLPIKYELYVRTLVKFIREARTKAVEPLFGDTVLPEKKTQ
jgi:hypothetical protein